MKILPFNALYPNKSLLVSPDSFFDTMGRDFSKHYNSGLFLEEKERAIYIYQISKNNKKYKGIVNNTSIEDLMNGNILFHEDTIAAKEQDMVQTSLERKAMIKPVLLFHPNIDSLTKIINAYIDTSCFYQCTLEDGTNHKFWKISNPLKIKKIQGIFKAKVPVAYIADGHHRCSITKRLYENKGEKFKEFNFNSLLSAYFSMDDVGVYDHVKMVSILDTLKPEIFIAELSKFAKIKHIKRIKAPVQKHEFVVLMNKEIYYIKWKPSVIKKFKKKGEVLDSFIMNEIVFEKILKIVDVRRDARISFSSGQEPIEQIMKKCFKAKNRLSIIQYPLHIKDVMNIASKGSNLPPKSTWFEPRIKSGVIAQKY